MYIGQPLFRQDENVACCDLGKVLFERVSERPNSTRDSRNKRLLDMC